MSAYSFKRVIGGKCHQPIISESPEIIEEFLDDFELNVEGPGSTGLAKGTSAFQPKRKWKQPSTVTKYTAGTSAVAKKPTPVVPVTMVNPTSSDPLSNTKILTRGNRTQSSTSADQFISKPSATNVCLLTASVSTVKQWSRYREDIPMLIEIFGTVEKLISDAEKPFFKVLHLNDGSSLVVRFYEIDRPLPKVVIGQYVRCVGRIDRDGCLLCVSIREANKQEQQWRNKLMAISARAMYKRMSSVTEN